MDDRVVILRLEADRYALPTACVRHVVATPGVTPVPTAPPAILGLMNLRGEVVPLLDLARLLGRPTVRSERLPYAVVVETANGAAGLTVSEMPRVERLGPEVGPSGSPGTAALHSMGEDLVALLDLDTLLDPSRVAAS
jgi:purine-binding chemotaxis protein CheW